MTSKYFYKGFDITLDIYEKARLVVELIAQREQVGFDAAFALFASSRAYKNLETPATLMWSESAEFVVDEFYRERGLCPAPCAHVDSV